MTALLQIQPQQTVKVILQPGVSPVIIPTTITGGGGAWGGITGTLTDQTDLVTYIATQLAALVASSPSTLDTLNELAAALGDDPNFATTITNALAGKAPSALSVDTVAGTAYTLGADSWHHKRFTNAAAVTLTINNTHGLTPGQRTRFTQVGAGQVTMVAGSGITLNSRDGALKSAGQMSVWEVECITSTEFDVLGDVTT